MQLSFVIPTRNQARFLRQCIDSCLAQAISDREVLVIDGASTDDTREVLATYGDRVRWLSEPDRGQSDAVNKGVRLAQGRVIAWINSDDYYAGPGVIRELLAAFADPGCDIAYGDGLRVDVAGRPLGPYRSRPIHRVAEIVTHPASFVLQPALLFRRQLFLDVGGLDESLHYAMDYELWVRLFGAAGRTHYRRDVIACARYHGGAKSIAAMGKQIREVSRVKLASADRLGLGPIDRARIYAGIASLGAYWVATHIGFKRAT